MPGKSKAQRGAAGMALAAKRGHVPAGRLGGPARRMYESMSEDELAKMASNPGHHMGPRSGSTRRRR